jgi:hypothetical protein
MVSRLWTCPNQCCPSYRLVLINDVLINVVLIRLVLINDVLIDVFLIRLVPINGVLITVLS